MSGYAFDANIIIDALAGYPPASAEIRRATESGSRAWMSRMAWLEVLSKGSAESLSRARLFLSGFAVDELDMHIADRAAALRRDRPTLKSLDAIILASAQVHGRVLVTRNTKDFPANMPGVRVPYTL
ncbi:type II toxin-antitoxin system VapC family toxin [Sphingomonas sp. RB3P16]|uniref:type II toxin-antitoxin system VapC family toxin n=1 Tax=Parasphingomonas frigoris TaxID=3096163 RepID=UPI002FCC1053